MEKSQLREAPYDVGRPRVFELMNSRAGAFTHVTRPANPEGARMSMHYAPGVRVEAWHQSGAELAALYSWDGAWILFDRFKTSEGTDTVVVVSAATLELQLAAGELIMSTQPSFEGLWSRAGTDE